LSLPALPETGIIEPGTMLKYVDSAAVMGLVRGVAYSQGSEDLTSDLKMQDLKQDGRSKLIQSVEQSSQTGSQVPGNLTMSGSAGNTTLNQSMSLSEDSVVRVDG